MNKYHRACQSLVLEILGCLLYNPLRNLERYKNILRISSPVKINLNYFCFSIFKTKSYFSYEFNKIVFTLLLEINAINFSALNISTRLTPAATSQCCKQILTTTRHTKGSEKFSEKVKKFETQIEFGIGIGHTRFSFLQMMPKISLTSVVSVIFLAYMANSLWSIASLYFPPACDSNCLKSGLLESQFKNGVRLILMSTNKARPTNDKDLSFIEAFDLVNLDDDYVKKIEMKLSSSVTKKNGTQFLALSAIPLDSKVTLDKASTKWNAWIRDDRATFSIIPLTKYHVPEAETFQLLGSEDEEKAAEKKKMPPVTSRKPVVHLRSKIQFSIMTDSVDLPKEGKDIPPEIYHYIRLSPGGKSYLPIVFVNELTMRLRDLVKINKTDETVSYDLEYSPISFGKLRLFSQFGQSLSGLHGLGFTEKDTDEVKGIFADTNLVLLLVTFAVSAVHLLFDFLAFKNEISFWRNRTTMEGILFPLNKIRAQFYFFMNT